MFKLSLRGIISVNHKKRGLPRIGLVVIRCLGSGRFCRYFHLRYRLRRRLSRHWHVLPSNSLQGGSFFNRTVPSPFIRISISMLRASRQKVSHARVRHALLCDNIKDHIRSISTWYMGRHPFINTNRVH